MKLYVSPSHYPWRQSRAGIVCSKEVFRRSVDRNRVKRRLRECYRLHQERLKTGMDLALVANKQMARNLPPGFGEIVADFLDLCEKAGLLRTIN